MMDNSFTDAELRLCQDFILKLAINAGTLIHKGFYTEQKNIAEKASAHDLVTETDSAVERFLISEISDRFPTHRFIGEEATAEASKNDLFSHKLTDEPTWMIDPIDGTMNFVHTNPNVCISIGLIASKIPVLGVIYNPIENELYTARFNGGAYLNGKPISVAKQRNLAHSLVMTEFGTHTDCLPQRQSMVAKVLPKVHGIRATGSAALNMAMVAKGAVDANYEFGLHCWDMAAGAIIVREAGGVVVDTTNGELDLMSRRVLCASNAGLAQELAHQLDSNIFNFPRD